MAVSGKHEDRGCKAGVGAPRARAFWKHEPPKPTDDLRNLGPMRESTPMACATSATLAPVTSHSAEIELIDEMRCARKAFAVSLESSADQRLVVSTCGLGTQRR